jgi:hypothetical protein
LSKEATAIRSHGIEFRLKLWREEIKVRGGRISLSDRLPAGDDATEFAIGEAYSTHRLRVTLGQCVEYLTVSQNDPVECCMIWRKAATGLETTSDPST